MKKQYYYPYFLAEPPKLTPDLKTINQCVTIGDDLKLVASVSGVPHPKIMWFKDGAEVGESTAATFSEEKSTSGKYVASFKISKCNKDHEGVYQIVVSNDFGSETAEFAVKIKSDTLIFYDLKLFIIYLNLTLRIILQNHLQNSRVNSLFPM